MTDTDFEDKLAEIECALASSSNSSSSESGGARTGAQKSGSTPASSASADASSIDTSAFSPVSAVSGKRKRISPTEAAAATFTEDDDEPLEPLRPATAVRRGLGQLIAARPAKKSKAKRKKAPKETETSSDAGTESSFDESDESSISLDKVLDEDSDRGADDDVLSGEQDVRRSRRRRGGGSGASGSEDDDDDDDTGSQAIEDSSPVDLVDESAAAKAKRAKERRDQQQLARFIDHCADDGTFCLMLTPLNLIVRADGKFMVIGATMVDMRVVDDNRFARSVLGPDVAPTAVSGRHCCGRIESIASVAQMARTVGEEPAETLREMRDELAKRTGPSVIGADKRRWLIVGVLIDSCHIGALYSPLGMMRLRVKQVRASVLGAELWPAVRCAYHHDMRGPTKKDRSRLVITEAEERRFAYRDPRNVTDKGCVEGVPVAAACAFELELVELAPLEARADDNGSDVINSPIAFERQDPARWRSIPANMVGMDRPRAPAAAAAAQAVDEDADADDKAEEEPAEALSGSFAAKLSAAAELVSAASSSTGGSGSGGTGALARMRAAVRRMTGAQKKIAVQQTGAGVVVAPLVRKDQPASAETPWKFPATYAVCAAERLIFPPLSAKVVFLKNAAERPRFTAKKFVRATRITATTCDLLRFAPISIARCHNELVPSRDVLARRLDHVRGGPAVANADVARVLGELCIGALGNVNPRLARWLTMAAPDAKKLWSKVVLPYWFVRGVDDAAGGVRAIVARAADEAGAVPTHLNAAEAREAGYQALDAGADERMSADLVTRVSLVYMPHAPQEVWQLALLTTYACALIAFRHGIDAVRAALRDLHSPSPHALLFVAGFGRSAVSRTGAPNWFRARFDSFPAAGQPPDDDDVDNDLLRRQLALLVSARQRNVSRFDYARRERDAAELEALGATLVAALRVDKLLEHAARVRTSNDVAYVSDALLRRGADVELFDRPECPLRAVRLCDTESRRAGAFERVAMMRESDYWHWKALNCVLGPRGAFTERGVTAVRVETRADHDAALVRAVRDELDASPDADVIVLCASFERASEAHRLLVDELGDALVEANVGTAAPDSPVRVRFVAARSPWADAAVDRPANRHRAAIVVPFAHQIDLSTMYSALLALTSRYYADTLKIKDDAAHDDAQLADLLCEAHHESDFASGVGGVRDWLARSRAAARCGRALTLIGLPLTPTSVHEATPRCGPSLLDDVFFACRARHCAPLKRYVEYGRRALCDGADAGARMPLLRAVSGAGALLCATEEARVVSTLDRYGAGTQWLGLGGTALEFIVRPANAENELKRYIAEQREASTIEHVYETHVVLWPMDADARNPITTAALSIAQPSASGQANDRIMRHRAAGVSGSRHDRAVSALENRPAAVPLVRAPQLTVIALDAVPANTGLDIAPGALCNDASQLAAATAARELARSGPHGRGANEADAAFAARLERTRRTAAAAAGSLYDSGSAAVHGDQLLGAGAERAPDGASLAAIDIELHAARMRERQRLHHGVSLSALLGTLFDRPRAVRWFGELRESLLDRLRARCRTPEHLLTPLERDRLVQAGGAAVDRTVGWFDSYEACAQSALPYTLGAEARDIYCTHD